MNEVVSYVVRNPIMTELHDVTVLGVQKMLVGVPTSVSTTPNITTKKIETKSKLFT